MCKQTIENIKSGLHFSKKGFPFLVDAPIDTSRNSMEDEARDHFIANLAERFGLNMHFKTPRLDQNNYFNWTIKVYPKGPSIKPASSQSHPNGSS